MKKVLLVSAVLFALVGCSEDKEDIKDVEYYRTHKDERKDKLKECRASAEKSLSINCENATQAERLAEASKTGGIRL